MKRLFALILCLVTLISLCACGAQEETPATVETIAPETSAATEPATEPTTPPAPVEVKKDFSSFANIVADPKSWYEGLMALPIANSNMTEQELRQLCVDAMRYNLTFQWTPTMDLSYSFTLLERTSEVYLPQKIAYSGLFYCNNNAKGNVWKALNYYDVETGAMDILAMNGDFLSVLSSACARGCEWGWSRVSNSTGLENMSSYNQYNSNISLVGPYTYLPGKYAFGNGDGTKRIIEDNGVDVMLESYAAMKMADGVYSSSSYHVMMVAEDPVIVYDANGKIDPVESYAIILEQDAVGSKTDKQDIKQSNGITLRQLGGVDRKYTFQDLLNKGYVPFTIKELIGEDPVEAAEAYIGSQNAPVANGTDMILDEIFSKTLFTNYAICALEAQVKNPAGEVLLSEKYGPISTPLTMHCAIRSEEFSEKAPAFANGENTVHIYVRLSTGELKEAFTTVLKIN